MPIVNLSASAIVQIAEAITRADAEGVRFRIAFSQSGGVNNISYKVGEGAWSPPFYDQPDPYASPMRKFSEGAV